MKIFEPIFRVLVKKMLWVMAEMQLIMFPFKGSKEELVLKILH
jgi:hypothetical protein